MQTSDYHTGLSLQVGVKQIRETLCISNIIQTLVSIFGMQHCSLMGSLQNIVMLWLVVDFPLLTFKCPTFLSTNAHKQMPLAIHFIYLVNKETDLIFETCCVISVLLLMGRKLPSITQLNVYNRWYVLDWQKPTCFGQWRPSSGFVQWAIRAVYNVPHIRPAPGTGC